MAVNIGLLVVMFRQLFNINKLFNKLISDIQFKKVIQMDSSENNLSPYNKGERNLNLQFASQLMNQVLLCTRRLPV